jgi:hypothetical protein
MSFTSRNFMIAFGKWCRRVSEGFFRTQMPARRTLMKPHPTVLLMPQLQLKRMKRLLIQAPNMKQVTPQLS